MLFIINFIKIIFIFKISF